MNTIIITFEAQIDAARMQMVASRFGLSGRMIRQPAGISPGCGNVWAVPEKSESDVLAALAEHNIQFLNMVTADCDIKRRR